MNDRSLSDDWMEAANCLAIVTHQLSSALHEANNLLQVVSGSADVILMKPSLPPDVQRRAETITEHARRVSTLLGGLRELSHCAPPAPASVTDLTAVVASALELRRHALTRDRVGLSLTGLEQANRAAVDWRSAMQAGLNLLLNAEEAALAAGQQGSARPEFPAIAVAVSTDGDVVTVSVEDNGHGDGHTKSDGCLRRSPDTPPHLGIGLATARAIARRCGGALHQQTLPAGTVTMLRLPAAR